MGSSTIIDTLSSMINDFGFMVPVSLTVPIGKSELDLQLSANELFEKGYTNIAVSKELRLLPNQVLQFRKAYNELVKSDIDDEIAKRVAQKKALESAIQQYDARVMQSEKILKEKQDVLERIKQEIHRSEVSRGSLKDEITLLNEAKEQLNRKIDTRLRLLTRYKAKEPLPKVKPPWWNKTTHRSSSAFRRRWSTTYARGARTNSLST